MYMQGKHTRGLKPSRTGTATRWLLKLNDIDYTVSRCFLQILPKCRDMFATMKQTSNIKPWLCAASAKSRGITRFSFHAERAAWCFHPFPRQESSFMVACPHIIPTDVPSSKAVATGSKEVFLKTEPGHGKCN